MQNMYYADTKACEFNDKLVEEINQWCASKTHDMIPSILDNIPADAISILANALYFDAEWMKPYEEHQVKEENFTATDGKVSIVEGLHETSELPYYENDHYVYDIDASPKVEIEPKPDDPDEPDEPDEPKDPDELPDTGLTNWPIPVMAGCGFVLICVGATLKIRGRER